MRSQNIRKRADKSPPEERHGGGGTHHVDFLKQALTRKLTELRSKKMPALREIIRETLVPVLVLAPGLRGEGGRDASPKRDKGAGARGVLPIRGR